MSVADAFVDTNVVLYLLSSDAAKANRAEEILSAGAVINVQVLNEATHVMRRKWEMPWAEVRDVLDRLADVCEVTALSVETQRRAIDIAQSTGLGIYDANIVSAAIDSGSGVLFSEDLSDGQRFDKVRVKNPFKAAAK